MARARMGSKMFAAVNGLLLWCAVGGEKFRLLGETNCSYMGVEFISVLEKSEEEVYASMVHG